MYVPYIFSKLVSHDPLYVRLLYNPYTAHVQRNVRWMHMRIYYTIMLSDIYNKPLTCAYTLGNYRPDAAQQHALHAIAAWAHARAIIICCVWVEVPDCWGQQLLAWPTTTADSTHTHKLTYSHVVRIGQRCSVKHVEGDDHSAMIQTEHVQHVCQATTGATQTTSICGFISYNFGCTVHII